MLEIGFGRGLLLAGLLEDGHEVTGVDPGMLETDVVEAVRRKGTLYREPAESARLPDAHFDVVLGIHVVEHLADPAAVLRASHRALRDGGLLYLMTPSAASRGLRVFRESWWNLEDPTHVRFFSPRSISITLRTAGFDRVVTRVPIWDSLTIEISSLIRLLKSDPGEHGVLGSRALFPAYALMLPVALAARVLWPDLAPSMEVLAWKRG